MTERWHFVPGYEGYYQVSDQGKVFSVRSQELMVPAISPKGHPKVGLCLNGFSEQVHVSRLVALAFVGKPSSSRLQVHHLNGDPADNRAQNLRWITPAENQRRLRAESKQQILERRSTDGQT